MTQYYRDQAARVARLAATSRFADLRDEFLQLARHYETLARRATMAGAASS